MKRLAIAIIAGIALGAIGCERREPPPVRWLYDAPLPLVPRPPPSDGIGFGRDQAPISLDGAGIVAAPRVTGGPLAIERLIAAGDDGAAEAVAAGRGGDGVYTVELIDVDAGVVRWRNREANLAPLVIAGPMVVVGDGGHLMGLDRASGGLRWQIAAALRARDRGFLIATAGGKAIAIDAVAGKAEPPRPLPDGMSEAAVIAACGTATRYLLAWQDGQLARWDLGDRALRLAWSVATPPPSRIDACGATVIVLADGAATALDPLSGAVVGGPIAARELWPARRGDGVELATADGVERRDRRLATPELLEPVIVTRLLARRGGRRLVLGDAGGPVLLDDRGARALAEPYGAAEVALGDLAVLGGPWAPPSRTQVARLARWMLPAGPPADPDDARATPGRGLAAPLLGDPPRLDLPAAIAMPPPRALEGAGAWAIGAAFVDPDRGDQIYANVLEEQPSETRGSGIAAYDLTADQWRWYARDACLPGTPIAVAAAATVVVCGTRGASAGHGAVRAVRKSDGAIAWDWHGDTVDALLSAGGAERRVETIAGRGDVVIVIAGARAIVLDAATGAERARWWSSDGYWPRIAAVARRGDTVIASAEHGRIVLRSARLGLRPFASIAVRGTLVSLFAQGDRIAAALADGSLYTIDDRGVATAAGALAAAWIPAGDLAVAAGVADDGAGLVLGFAGDGTPRITAGLPGTGAVAVAPRGNSPIAPLAVTSTPGAPRATVLAADGHPLAVVDLPPDAPRVPIVTTAVGDTPVVAFVLARPLRLFRLDLGAK